MLSKSIFPWLTTLLRQPLTPQTMLVAASRCVNRVHLQNRPTSWFNIGATGRTYFLELKNRVTAFTLFNSAHRILHSVPRTAPRLRNFTTTLRDSSSWHALWKAEGLGYYHAVEALKGRAIPKGLLSSASLEGVPPSWLVPLHTGMGMAFANDYCHGRNSAERVGVATFLDLCEANSTFGYSGAAIEAMGLVCSLVRPESVSAVSEEFEHRGSDCAQRFWHGYGRGLYFSATNFLPCANMLWPALDRAKSEPTSESGRANAVAGLAWAITLINVRHPEVLETFLSTNHPDLHSDAFANGVNSALIVWSDWAPDSTYAEDLFDHVRKTKLHSFVEAFRRQICVNCDRKSGWQHRELKQRNRVQDLFRYQPVLSE